MADIKYNVRVTRIIDGDTITADLLNISNSLFFNIISEGPITLINQKIRLYGILAPEIFGKEKLLGYRSKNYLSYLLKDQQSYIIIHSRHFEKYGRILATLYITGYSTPDINVNELMISEKYALPALYIRGKFVQTNPNYNSLVHQFPFR